MSEDMRQQVSEYNNLVQQYHTLDEEIDDLLLLCQGQSENMSDESRQQYRKLAHQRDIIFNQMRTMEQSLFAE